ncbi:hypothetical protein [Terrabacter sp. NPDC080008]|uniref:hypothetical protein n=1 Tax=Terrabacter sp. NPDC080008 TaxID=3155176 RepID=UPI00344B362E
MSGIGSVRWSDPQLTWTEQASTRTIARVRPPGVSMVWVAGEHVAFERPRSQENWGDWELFLWDSTRRRGPVRLDESDGLVPAAPFLLVTATDRALAWLHPLRDGRREVRLHDLGTGKTTVVHVGHVGAPLIAGRLLMWPEAFAQDAPARLVAVDVETHQPVLLPPQLAELRDPQEMSSDGRTFAWASADRTRLMAWRQGWPEPRLVAGSTEGNAITWPKVSGDTVSWVADRTYTADLRSGSYVAMTKAWGGAGTWGPYLHIGVSKGVGRSFHLATAALPPLPRC